MTAPCSWASVRLGQDSFHWATESRARRWAAGTDGVKLYQFRCQTLPFPPDGLDCVTVGA
eukprot:2787792-Rhodomonas_salina.2